MNRRRFLELTIAFAAAAELPSITQAHAPAERWIPTEAEVAEWLEYHKVAVRIAHEDFSAAVEAAFAVGGDGNPLAAGAKRVEELQIFEEAERAFNNMAAVRVSVSVAQGWGYRAGREGLPRCEPRYEQASYAGYGWYNGWEVGNFDYLWRTGLVCLMPSPGQRLQRSGLLAQRAGQS